MGTRNATLVQLDGDYKIGQYCQWDGYPEGQGHTVYKFLTQPGFDKQKFISQLRKLKILTSEEVEKKQNEVLGYNCPQWVNMEESEKLKAAYPQLDRDMGAEVLQAVYDGSVEEVFRDYGVDFPKQSLWCEWAYVIDMDKNVLEVYEGFNQSPNDPTDRFYIDKPQNDSYYGCKLVGSFDLDNLPEWEEFLVKVSPKEEEVD